MLASRLRALNEAKPCHPVLISTPLAGNGNCLTVHALFHPEKAPGKSTLVEMIIIYLKEVMTSDWITAMCEIIMSDNNDVITWDSLFSSTL